MSADGLIWWFNIFIIIDMFNILKIKFFLSNFYLILMYLESTKTPDDWCEVNYKILGTCKFNRAFNLTYRIIFLRWLMYSWLMHLALRRVGRYNKAKHLQYSGHTLGVFFKIKVSFQLLRTSFLRCLCIRLEATTPASCCWFTE